MKKISKVLLIVLVGFTFAILNISEVGAVRGTSSEVGSVRKGSQATQNSADRSKDYQKGGRESGGNLSQGKNYEEAKETIDKNNEKNSASVDDIKKWGETDGTGETTPNVGDCSVIGGETKNFLNKIFSYISIIGIIIVVIMSILDGIKVITASEDGAMGNFLKGLRVRIICLVLLLILPMLVTFVVSTINNVANIAGVNSDNPLCGVTK